MENLLQVDNLHKSYFTKKVLKGANFVVPKGRIVGLLGPNGSGKTTLMRAIAGLVKFNKGSITVEGKAVGYETKSLVSFMPDSNILDKGMSVNSSIKLYNDFFSDFNMEKAMKLQEFYKLDEDIKVKDLSKGNVEKLQLLLTLSRDAKLYVLDEPLGGIDPVVKTKIIDSILEYFSGDDSSLIISTHLLKDTERLFDDALFLKDGIISLAGSCDDLRAEHGKTIEELYIEIFS